MKSRRTPAYLHWRPDSQFPAFRYTVRKDMLPFWSGPKTICLSLRTAEPAHYRRLVADYVSYYDAYFERLREVNLRPWRRLDAVNVSVLSAEVSHTLEEALLDSDAEARQQMPVQGGLIKPLFALNTQHETGLPPKALDEHQLCMDRLVVDLGRQAALHDYSAADPFLDALLPYLHIAVERGQIEYESLRLSAMQALLRAHRKIQLVNAEALLRCAALAPGKSLQSLAVAVPAPPVNVSPAESARVAMAKTGPTIDELVKDWKGKEGSRNACTVHAVQSAIRELTAFCQVTHVSELTKAIAVNFRKHLMEHGSAQTAQTKIGLISAVFNFALRDDRIKQSPFQGVSVRLPRNLPKARVSFDADDVQRIFSHPIFSERVVVAQSRAGGIAAYWLPLMACFTGARMEEIGQLKQGDFKKGAGQRKIDYFEINNAEGNETKTVTSNREVPLHPVLIRLGLLDYVASLPTPGAALFPDLKRNKFGKLTGSFSKWFGGFLRVDVGISDPRKTFHSFRHGFATNWRVCGLPENVRFVIDGHAPETVGAMYGETPLSLQSQYMNQLVIEGFPL